MELSAVGDRIFAAESIIKRRVRKVNSPLTGTGVIPMSRRARLWSRTATIMRDRAARGFERPNATGAALLNYDFWGEDWEVGSGLLQKTGPRLRVAMMYSPRGDMRTSIVCDQSNARKEGTKRTIGRAVHVDVQ